MHALVVDDCDECKVSGDLPKFDTNSVSSLTLQDSIARATANKLDNFNRDTTGFTATSNFQKDSIVYLTVPNDAGWTAQIDDQETDIINSCGLMAIKVPAGTHEICFSYTTPAFELGIIVSAISWIIFVTFIIASYSKSKRRSCSNYQSSTLTQ
ncbi:MAG: YfhO family protein [Enterococcus sp.]|nr:YfhO family protein [Enterococcus sp.]